MLNRLIRAATNKMNDGVANVSLGYYCDTMATLLKLSSASPIDEEMRGEVRDALRILGPLVAGNTFSQTPNRSAIQENMLRQREIIFWFCQTFSDTDIHQALALHVQFMGSGKFDARQATEEWSRGLSIKKLSNYPKFSRLRQELCDLTYYDPDTDPLRHSR